MTTIIYPIFSHLQLLPPLASIEQTRLVTLNLEYLLSLVLGEHFVHSYSYSVIASTEIVHDLIINNISNGGNS